TGFVRDGIDLTAAVIASPNTSYAAAVDATPCNVAVYVGPGVTGVDVSAEVYGANYFGVVVNGGSASLDGANIHGIGESPFNGSQHGVGVYFVGGATGSVTDSTVSAYQKGGIVANGSGTKVTITDNTVTGLGKVDFIAQNGIQISRGALAEVRGNDISDNSFRCWSWRASNRSSRWSAWCGQLHWEATDTPPDRER
ncbi:MAG: right-handed parallel beta-helix repeat-containing protein, partial [Chloroflexi bacterium]|nr:right-handed parallel beta-helix repeat-containing protein [Chloroflexota bacterium]